jgi:pre-mRNA-processing factor 6
LVEPEGTSLPDSVAIEFEAGIGNTKRASILSDSPVKSNSSHVLGRITVAHFEEHAGKMVAVRKLTKSCFGPCPEGEDVWLEAVPHHVYGLLISTGFRLFLD